ncbi:hypothetical protein HDU96_005375 [Phlyctochytrium bullatum]|nr:hypothetical protein HDU96_005375 [Phlyctochytrium bullatum]
MSSLTQSLVEIQPEIYITVIAEAGGGSFRKEENPGATAFCENRPAFTLVQDIQVTSSNLFVLAEQLADGLNYYENVLIRHRQADEQRKRHEQNGNSYREYRESATEDRQRPDSSLQFTSTTSLISQQGKPAITEPNTFNSLDHALFALKLLPHDAKPCIVFLTDGVSQGLRNGEFVFRDSCRRIAKDNINFTVIQAGSCDGFVPSVNFGHVPDNEALRFLAVATFGKFVYGSDCKYLDVETITVPATAESVSQVTQPPNFYHLQLLIRDFILTKSEKENLYRTVHAGLKERNVDLPRARLINAEIDSSQYVTKEELRFPWDVNSKPPLIAEILCGYRDYQSSTGLEYLIHARLLEGFSLRSVHLVRKANRKSDKVEIILARPWLPNVTIQYKIKTVWLDTDLPLLLGVATKPPRIELNILAHHAFAIQFVNVQDIEVKPERLMKLHNYLRGVYEMDEFLKMVSSFNTEAVLSVIPKQDSRLFQTVSNRVQGSKPVDVGEQQTNIWHLLCHIGYHQQEL